MALRSRIENPADNDQLCLALAKVKQTSPHLFSFGPAEELLGIIADAILAVIHSPSEREAVAA